MPYTINKYNGAQITVVADGTIDSTLDVKLIGKNYAGYGEVQNENLVFMLENFANNNPPPRPLSGQLWFDTGTSKLKFYDSRKWRTTGGAEISPYTAPPTGLTTGDFWFDTTNNQLKAWNADTNTFVLIGPEAVAGTVTTTQMRSRGITDTNGTKHSIIEAIANDQTVFVINPDAEFSIPTDPGNKDYIGGYSKLFQGVTLKGTVASGSGQGTSPDFRYHGTATNSLKLGGFAASSYVRSDVQPNFSAVVKFSDDGYTIGANDRIHVYNSAGYPTFEADTSRIEFKTKDPDDNTVKNPLNLVKTDLLPGSSDLSNIGSQSLQYSKVYAAGGVDSVGFEGIARKVLQVKDLSTGNFVSAHVSTAGSQSHPSTIAVRDGNGKLNAFEFQGVATSAYYADLAEKYLADQEYEVGTVMIVGGEKEVTASIWGKRAIGAVSANPAFKMNEGLEGGTYVALKGRVPVKVIGRIKKGDELIAANDGCASFAVPHANGVFAIALESSDDAGVKLVECLIL